MKTLGELGKYQQRRRLAIGAVVVLLVVALLFVSSQSTGHFHEYIEAFGLSLIVAAIIGRMWCTLYIGGRKSAEIVQSGPYSVTRNPLYVFSSIGAMGIGAQTGSIIIAIAFGVLCYLAFSVVIRTEEKFLKQNFGKPYEAYCASVPRFFPKFSLFRDDKELIVRPDRIYRTFQDGLVFFVAYPFFEFVEYLQDIHVLPVLLRLY
ncbi:MULTISPECIES: methyltransferase family protein [Brucella/Ochrobactrum group]|jgi:protein-S-isoprenylcysteine O-methyltransferase Ste14|uniref:Isoprenylcysteine carboxyl methyltransferase n=4 Tax=Brucella TaxID=234 RepID=A6WX20_BRUA4|nr:MULTISPECIES: isoprenylcysteine carboxylmethyltransferase family protein [Brucella/Ochrobactrum group]MCR5940011.1 isoprenylcysteine carboxylmethyltransferase family protein [Ochrobactrum sp. XJ1]QOD63478.1 isoprenylcysteine carboxylmethyltransferase family protein [Ochrobactrum sp. MT180101]QTN03884.1 isoprenylcysteine carboxylmethyltransferase family protein [Ochrobactrum sp. EEELCW01]RNL45448.1 isoprenylcysteine carboxylmethyltransferase family protein [Ochrobactrum sp. MH181795]ABS13524